MAVLWCEVLWHTYLKEESSFERGAEEPDGVLEEEVEYCDGVNNSKNRYHGGKVDPAVSFHMRPVPCRVVSNARCLFPASEDYLSVILPTTSCTFY